MIRVTRKYRFSASHRLHSGQLSESENQNIYGKCNYPFGHGHNYELEVSVKGPVEEKSGRALDRSALDKLVSSEVLSAFDHKNLNAEVAAFADTVPTTENLGIEIHRRLKTKWRSAFPGAWPALDRVRIAETSRNIFEVRDDGQE